MLLVSLPLLFVILTFVVYRVTYFVIEDSLFDGTREAIYRRLRFHDHEDGTWGNLWRDKLYVLLSCPYCVSVHVAGWVVLIHHFFVDPLPSPVWWWPALSGAGLLAWSLIED